MNVASISYGDSGDGRSSTVLIYLFLGGLDLIGEIGFSKTRFGPCLCGLSDGTPAGGRLSFYICSGGGGIT